MKRNRNSPDPDDERDENDPELLAGAYMIQSRGDLTSLISTLVNVQVAHLLAVVSSTHALLGTEVAANAAIAAFSMAEEAINELSEVVDDYRVAELLDEQPDARMMNWPLAIRAYTLSSLGVLLGAHAANLGPPPPDR